MIIVIIYGRSLSAQVTIGGRPAILLWKSGAP
jgi:hypothetical protein